MSTKIGNSADVEGMFEVIKLIEKLRDIFRQTAPLHILNSQQKQQAKQLLSTAKNILDKLEKSLCG
ncbi:MAG: hypothetical protein AB1414_09060 [bacterium]